jgi:hypothetical protein
MLNIKMKKMKKIISYVMLMAFGLMVACTGQEGKDVKTGNKDSAAGKNETEKMSCRHMGSDSCKMENCCTKVYDSLCNELSKLISQIVDLKVKQALCCMHKCEQEKEMKCDPAKCDPAKCDPNCKHKQ